MIMQKLDYLVMEKSTSNNKNQYSQRDKVKAVSLWSYRYSKLIMRLVLGVFNMIYETESSLFPLSCKIDSPKFLLTLTLPSATIVILANFPVCAEKYWTHYFVQYPNWRCVTLNASQFNTSIPCQHSLFVSSKIKYFVVPEVTSVSNFFGLITYWACQL